MSIQLNRTRGSLGWLCAVALVAAGVLAWSGPAAAAPANSEPGVTLRVFNLDDPGNAGDQRTRLCALKPAQTPNIDKIMPTIDWISNGDFGLERQFQAEVTGSLETGRSGSYTFRLTSDDGSRLVIDDQLVISHDGLRGAQPPAEGAVDLTAGDHTLFIEYFQNVGDKQLKLEWRTPGSTAFTVVPTSALSTPIGAVRVVNPGYKECAGGGDSPGDGLRMNRVHPNYDLTNLLPAGFEPQVSGLAFRGNDLIVTDWGGNKEDTQGPFPNVTDGNVWLVGNVTGATGPGQVTVKKIADGLREPMGAQVVDNQIYICEKNGLTQLVDSNGDDVADEKRRIATIPTGGNFHEFCFGLEYADGFFYANLSVAIDYGGNTSNPQPAGRGVTVKINKDTGEVTPIAGGLRTPHGIGRGCGGELFATDNQGGWLPSSKLLHIQEGRFYNHYSNPAGAFENVAPTPPVLWMPQNEIANSPSDVMCVPSGPFAGQVMIGDVTYGGIQRGYLEKVGGEFQGALFRHSQGFQAGVSRLLERDGQIYVGGIGVRNEGNNWRLADGGPQAYYGLQKLTPNGTDAFDIRQMRAVAGGFELEYTQPLSAQTASALATKYTVKQWRYVPTAQYGGPKVDEATLSVTSATLSADGKTVNLQIGGLQAGHVVYVRSPQPFADRSGTPLVSTEAWYTLNNLPGGSPPPVSGNLALNRSASADSSCSASEGAAKAVNGSVSGGNSDKWCSLGADQSLRVDLASVSSVNRFVVRHSGAGGEQTGWNTRDFAISVSANGSDWTQVVSVTGNTSSVTTHDITAVQARYVRLDITTPTSNADPAARIYELEVYGEGGGSGTGRVTLFDGSGLDAWEKTDGSPATWPVAGGSVESFGGDIQTKQCFGDYRLNIEFLIPQLPDTQTGQNRGNSGVYLSNSYELQVLDSFGVTALTTDNAGGIYEKAAPTSNQATAPLTWQKYEVTVRAPRFSGGTKTENARVTVVWNGVTVHDNIEIDGATGGGAPEGTCGKIRLQDHGDPNDNPRFRDIWVEPLG